MAAASGSSDLNREDLTEIVRQIRERVRAQYPSGEARPAGVALPDLLPLLHARDAAEGKVAAIGSVNPRTRGLVNGIIQSVKRLVARALDWHIREQVEFNRAMVNSVNATLETLNEVNRSLAKLASSYGESDRNIHGEYQQLQDIRTHWEQWRQGWESKLAAAEIQFLRSVAELQGAYQHRVTDVERSFQNRLTDLERSFRELVRSQHQEFTFTTDKAVTGERDRLREDLDSIRTEYERLIYNELRVVRQRAAGWGGQAISSAAAPEEAEAPQFDYLRFSERFRGSEEYVKQSQEFYIERFRGRRNVLDLGCGRGEFLEAANPAGVPARGVEMSSELAAICRGKGLDVEHADMFRYLDSMEGESLDGIFCAQVIEHLPPRRLPELIRLAAEKLSRDGLLVFETPNPECLAIFASHFYIDPTHTRPVPASLLVFYLEESGFGRIEVHPRSPAIDSMPSLSELPEAFRKAFFGGLDYAVIARRL